MTVLDIIAYLLLIAAALTSLVAMTMSFALHSSDAAGNGLAQAYLVFTAGFAWLCVGLLLLVTGLRTPAANVPPEWSWGWISVATLLLFGLALAGQLGSMLFLGKARDGGAVLLLVQLGVAAVPLAFVLHAAWRGLGWSLPPGLATWGCASVVVIGSVVPWLAHAARVGVRAQTIPAIERIVYPALLLQSEDAVCVLRSADDLLQLPSALLAPAEPLLIDANCAAWTLRNVRAAGGTAPPPTSDGRVAVAFGLEPSAEPLDFPALVARLLRIATLHDDPAEDAKIRRLIAMQHHVTGLSFVLPH